MCLFRCGSWPGSVTTLRPPPSRGRLPYWERLSECWCCAGTADRIPDPLNVLICFSCCQVAALTETRRPPAWARVGDRRVDDHQLTLATRPGGLDAVRWPKEEVHTRRPGCEQRATSFAPPTVKACGAYTLRQRVTTRDRGKVPRGTRQRWQYHPGSGPNSRGSKIGRRPQVEASSPPRSYRWHSA